MQPAQKIPDSTNFLFKQVGRNPIAKAVRTAREFHQRIVPAEKIYKRKRLNMRDFDGSDE